MKIQIENNIYLESDKYGYQIKQYNGTRFDEKLQREVEVSSTLAYYGTVKACCNFLVDMKLKESTATDLRELLTEVENIRTWIDQKVTV